MTTIEPSHATAVEADGIATVEPAPGPMDAQVAPEPPLSSLAPRYQVKPVDDTGKGFVKGYREHGPALLTWTFLGLIMLVAFVLCLYLVPRLLVPTPANLSSLTGETRVNEEIALATARNGVRTPLIQAVAGLAFLITAFLAWRQVLVARRGQQVETFTKSIEQLGNEKDDVRLGGIYALQQLSYDARYARPVAEVFAAYLRIHCKLPDDVSRTSVASGKTLERRPPADVQAVAEILLSDGLWDKTMREPLDLSGTFLRGIQLPYARLNRAMLYGCDLSEAGLEKSDLSDADLRECNLRSCRLRGADLSRAWLHRSDLSDARLEEVKAADETKFEHGKLVRAILTNAQLGGADFTDCDLSEAHATGAVFSDGALIRANMSNSRLMDADFTGVRMTDAVLVGADILRADFSQADLREANFTGARNADQGDFEGADLTGVRGLRSRDR